MKKPELNKTGLYFVAYALLLLAVQLSLYYLLDPELTFTIDSRLRNGDELIRSLIALTPITVLVEEAGLRVVPYFLCVGVIQGWPSFKELVKHGRCPEAKNLDVLMVPLLGVLNGAIHLTNIEAASSLNLLKYFFTHFLGGAYLGTVFLRHGFRQVYATHLLYNLMALGLYFMPPAFW